MLCPLLLCGQDSLPKRPVRVFLSGGVGLATPALLLATGVAHAGYGKHMLSYRMAYTARIFSINDQERSLLYGRILHADINTLLHVSIGIGQSRLTEFLESDSNTYFSRHTHYTYRLSLPFEVGYYNVRLHGVGLGFSLMGNINSVRSYAGLAIVLLFGKLR